MIGLLTHWTPHGTNQHCTGELKDIGAKVPNHSDIYAAFGRLCADDGQQ